MQFFKKILKLFNIAFIKLDFPEPIEPIMATNSDFFTEKKANNVNYFDTSYNNDTEEITKNPYINKYFHSNKGNNVSWRTYLDYIKYQGGYFVFFILIILIIGSRIIESYRRTFIPSLSKSFKEIEANKDKDKNTTENFHSKLQLN